MDADDRDEPGHAPRRSGLQPALLLGALVVFALSPWPLVGAWVGAYLVLWLVASIAIARGARWARFAVRSRGAAGLGLAVVGLAVLVAWSRGAELLDTEGVSGLVGPLADRLRLEGSPAIAPPLVASDRPQVFWVNAPGAREVNVRFGDGMAPRTTLALGRGLFRLDYDPRRDGGPSPANGPITAELLVDGKSVKRTMAATTPLAHPRALSSSPKDGVAAAVSEETDELFLVHADGDLVRVATGDGPTSAIVLPGRGTVAVTHRYAGELGIYDAATGARVSRRGARPFAVSAAVSPDGTRLAVAIAGLEPGIELYDLDTDELQGFAWLPIEPDRVTFGPDAHTLIIASRRTRALHRFTEGDRPWKWSEGQSPIALGRPVLAMAATLDGARTVLSITDYRPDGGPGPNHFVEDQLVTVDAAAWRITRRTPSAQRDDDEGVIGGASPAGLAPRADGTMWVTFRGTDEVAIFDPIRGALLSKRTLSPALLRPHGVADLGGGAFVVTSAADGTLARAKSATAALELLRVTPTDEVLARDDRSALLARRGERSFLEATRSGVSCESCHPDADTDLSPHDIGQSLPRPTLSTLGIARTAPYLRGASYDAIGGLEHFASSILGGWRSDADDRVPALEAYVEQLPLFAAPKRLAPPPDPERLAAAFEVFLRAGCATCHAPPAFTNLAQYPATFLFPERDGELELLDTPSLFAVSASAPYLHDGRAKSLADVLEDAKTSGRHGDVRALSADDRALLLELLEAL